MPNLRVSFVSSLHNCLPLTQAMLDSLEQTIELEKHQVILIDDASSDETPAFLDALENRPGFTILRNEKNLGFAASNNKAVKTAIYDTIVFINNDLEFSDGWLEPMLEALNSAPQAGAVGNVQRNFETGLVDHAGIFFDLQGLPTHAHKHRCQPPNGKLIERNAMTAACLVIKKEILLEIGGFDEAYQNGCEDVDLCMKLKSKGLRLYVSLESVIRHHISVSPGRNDNNDRNTQIFSERWSDYSAKFGRQEWPKEYFRRYARYWWRINPRLALKALLLLLTRSR